MNLFESSFNYSDTYKIAILGSGPRGLSILERISARLLETSNINKNIELFLIDSVEIGCGRIWRTDQSLNFIMNTVADEVSAFSGPPNGVTRPGAGPSLAQWWEENYEDYPGKNSYAPRALHGEYMLYTLDSIEKNLPNNTKLIKIKSYVEDISIIDSNNIKLIFDNKTELTINKLILTTGHTSPEIDNNYKELENFCDINKEVKFIRGNSPADMPLHDIPPKSPVGIIGMGLSFYDVMAELTIGRGGKFEETINNEIIYIPSGKEPILYASSRSGIPIPVRGKNQKDPNYQYKHIILTYERVKELREKGPINFKKEIYPLLLSEMYLVYFEALIRKNFSLSKSLEFREKIKKLNILEVEKINNLAVEFGINTIPNLDLDTISQPFLNKKFQNPAEFNKELIKYLKCDIEEAEAGNVDSPLKSALDVIRDSRSLIRQAVDFSELSSESYLKDFLNWYSPKSLFLSAGPPRFRQKQLLALLNANILNIIGPSLKVEKSISQNSFLLESNQVFDSQILVKTLIDARVPLPNLYEDQSKLTKNLVKRGIWKAYTNVNGPEHFITGGVAVTQAPFHPICVNNHIKKNIYVLGIPIEHTRWFMQAGSSRPGFWTDFFVDADSIASDIVNYFISTELRIKKSSVEIPGCE